MRTLFIEASGAARLRAAEAFVRTFPPATEIVVLASTRGAADDFVRRIVLAGGASFGIHRLSLTQFASRVARRTLADDGRVAITRLAQEALASSTIFTAAGGGRLRYFEPVAAFPGFARSVASTISELRLAGVTDAELANASVSARDVAHLLSTFGEQLASQQASDLADLFAVASDVAASADAPLKSAPWSCWISPSEVRPKDRLFELSSDHVTTSA